MDVLVEDLSPETPIYVVTEGHEPPLFTRFFTWDYSKANVSSFPVSVLDTLAFWPWYMSMLDLVTVLMFMKYCMCTHASKTLS